MLIESITTGVVSNFLYAVGKSALGKTREHFAPNILQGRSEAFVKIADQECYETIREFLDKLPHEAMRRYLSGPNLDENPLIQAILAEIFLGAKFNPTVYNSQIKAWQDPNDEYIIRNYDDQIEHLRTRIKNRLQGNTKTAVPIMAQSIQHLKNRIESIPKISEISLAVQSSQRENANHEFTLAYVEAWQANVRYLLINGLDAKARRDRVINDLASSYVPISLSGTEDYETSSGTDTAEDACRQLRKIIIRGEAGSGKTTLLHKMILDFDKSAGLHSQAIPLYIPLRRIERDLALGYDVEKAIIDGLGDTRFRNSLPMNWLKDLASTTNELIFMFDGIDEVRTENRSRVWKLISATETKYPKCKFIVTSRHLSAVHLADGSYRPDSFSSPERYDEYIESWGPPDSFFDFCVRPFTNLEVANLIERWFDGVDLDAVMPSERDKIQSYAERLKSKIFDSENAKSLDLARNPLLCALFCIVAFLDQGNLPESRKDLYEKATNLLVATRDAARGVDVPPEFAHFGLNERLEVLQRIALTMQDGAVAGTTDQAIEIDKTKAIEWTQDWIDKGVHNWAFDASSLIKFLLDRCTIIREPSIGRIDFVHRSFMEYLAAQEICSTRSPYSIRHSIFKDEWYNTLHFCMNTIDGGGHFAGQLFRDLAQAVKEHSRASSKRSGYLRILALLKSAKMIPEMYHAEISKVLIKILPLTSYEEAKDLFGIPPTILNECLNFESILELHGKDQTQLCAKLLANHPSDVTKIGLLTGYHRMADMETISAINNSGKANITEHFALLKRIQNGSYTKTVVVRPEDLSDKRLRHNVRNVGIKFPILDKEFKGWDVLHYTTRVKFIDVTRLDFEKMRDSVKLWKFDNCRKLEIAHCNGVSMDDVAQLFPALEEIEFTRGQAISFRGIQKLDKLRAIWLIGVSQPIRIVAEELPKHLDTIMLSRSSQPTIDGELEGCNLILDENVANRMLYVD